MPHVSKHKVGEKVRKELEKRILSFLSDTSADSRRFIFKELLTRTERLMIAKRLTMIFLLDKGLPVRTISKHLRISISTVLRFREYVERGDYAQMRKWIGKNKEGFLFGKILLDLLVLPFEAQRKSLNQLIGEDIKKYGR